MRKIFVKTKQSFKLKCLLASILTLSGFHNTLAAETRYSRSSHTPMDFSLSFSHADLNLNASNAIHPTQQRRISVALLDTVTPKVQLGFIIGSSYIDLNNDAATAGLYLNGNHIGFAINGAINGTINKHRDSNPQLKLHAHYIYQETKGENTLRSASLTWHEWLAEVSMRLNPGTHWNISIGGGLAGVSANRRVRGDINETLKTNIEAGFQGRIEIAISTIQDGRVSMTINRGIYDGMRLTFARIF